jgi:UDP-N-acetylglucosamine acyltransferase
MAIHPTAIVDPEAIVAGDVDIGAYTVIGPKVEIGSGTRIGPHVVIQGPTRIGKDNRISQFASIGDAPQDKKYNDEPTRLEIGDRNVFREFCTMNRGTTHDEGVTRIGSDNMFLANSHVGHDCIVGDKCVLSNNTALGGHVHIGDWVIVSAYSAVHQFCRIGAHAFLANNAAVTVDIPPYVMAVGQPAKPHSVNSAGLKRRGFSVDQVRNIRAAYRILYRSGLKREQAIEQLSTLVASQPELAALVEFFRSTSRRPRALR